MLMIYVASPYTVPAGKQLSNVYRSIDAAEELMKAGYCPVVPLYSHFHHGAYPHSWEEWLAIDIEKLIRCDAVLRLSGESKGADLEVREAKKRDIPVFESIEEIKENLNR